MSADALDHTVPTTEEDQRRLHGLDADLDTEGADDE